MGQFGPHQRTISHLVAYAACLVAFASRRKVVGPYHHSTSRCAFSLWPMVAIGELKREAHNMILAHWVNQLGNAGKQVGVKKPLKQRQIWAVRFFLDREGRMRNRIRRHIGSSCCREFVLRKRPGRS